MKVTCENCGWEGKEKDLITLNTTNPADPQDIQLIFYTACPECEEEI